MAFTLQIKLEDFGMRPVDGARFTVSPYNVKSVGAGGVLFAGPTDFSTGVKGEASIDLMSVPDCVWLAHSTGRGDFFFSDPGDGATINLADVMQVIAP